jgi:hypothetical protein
MMNEYELIWKYNIASEHLKMAGYKVSPGKTGFHITNSNNKIVGSVQTVDGVDGFLQGIWWAKEKDNE